MTDNTAAPNTAPAAAQPGAGQISHGTFSQDQLSQMAKWAVEGGSMTQEQADAALAADGVPAPAAASPVDAHLADIGFTPAKPEEFQLPPLVAYGEPFGKEAQAFDKAARTWLTTAKFDKAIGSYVAQEIERTAEKFQGMNPGERDLWQQGEMLKLERVYSRNFQAKIDGAKQLVAEIEKAAPGLVELLEITGAGNSASIVAMFCEQAERLAARPAGKG